MFFPFHVKPIVLRILILLILEYVKVRFYFEPKRWKDLNFSKKKTNVKTIFKLATTVHLKDLEDK